MRSILSIIIIVVFMGNAHAQLNDYKYIIVPKRFDAFKQPNQHLTSTLVKYLFSKKGYNVVYDDALPNDLYGNPCIGLTVRLDDNSSMFTTKTSLVLVDCNGREIFETQEGKSKQKDYKEGYEEAITKAFSSFDTLAYSYSGRGEAKEETVTLNFKGDVKTLEESDTETEKASATDQKSVVVQKATQEEQLYQSKEPVDSKKYVKVNKAATDVVEEVATSEEQLYKSKEPEVSKITKQAAEEPVSIEEISSSKVLYAQEIENGYQLVDSTPKIVLKILNTAVPNVFTAKVDRGNGVVYKKDDKWFFEYYIDDKQEIKELNIKF